MQESGAGDRPARSAKRCRGEESWRLQAAGRLDEKGVTVVAEFGFFESIVVLALGAAVGFFTCALLTAGKLDDERKDAFERGVLVGRNGIPANSETELSVLARTECDACGMIVHVPRGVAGIGLECPDPMCDGFLEDSGFHVAVPKPPVLLSSLRKENEA